MEVIRYSLGTMSALKRTYKLSINKNQEEMKNTVSEMKNTEQIKSRLDETASWRTR